jgi:hypothetical protein
LTGVIILLVAIGPAIVWFQSGYEWSFLWSVVITLISFLVGGIDGLGVGCFGLMSLIIVFLGD